MTKEELQRIVEQCASRRTMETLLRALRNEYPEYYSDIVFGTKRSKDIALYLLLANWFAFEAAGGSKTAFYDYYEIDKNVLKRGLARYHKDKRFRAQVDRRRELRRKLIEGGHSQ